MSEVLKKTNIKENPLVSLVANIFFPVIILKNGENWLQDYNQYFYLEIQAFTSFFIYIIVRISILFQY